MFLGENEYDASDYFARLPAGTFLKIMSYIPHDDFHNIRLVNRRFNDISYDVSLWKEVDLVRPRTMKQLCQLTGQLALVHPYLGANLRELKITGFHVVPIVDKAGHPRILDERSYQAGNPNEPKTLTIRALSQIQAACSGLKTLIIRNCSFEFGHDAHKHFPETLEKLEFHDCMLPDWYNWMGQMSTVYFMENLKTLKFERCFAVDTELRRYLRACPGIQHFSVKGSIMQIVGPYYLPSADPGFPSNIWGRLQSLDLSGTGRYAKLVHEQVLNDTRCPVTHLFMEQCPILPRPFPHLKIEFISVAGYRPSDGVGNAFEDIDAWASISTMKRINASGCDLTPEQRNELVRKHPGVVFNLSEYYDESPRVES